MFILCFMYWSVFLTRSTLCREWLCLVCCAPLCLFNSFHIVLCIALSRVVYYSVSLTRSTLCCAVHRCVLCTVVSFRPVPHRVVLCIALCCVLSCLPDPFHTVLCCAVSTRPEAVPSPGGVRPPSLHVQHGQHPVRLLGQLQPQPPPHHH